MSKRICFYHNKCLDGIAAAWCFNRAFGEGVELIPLDHGKEVDYAPLVEDKVVYFADFAPNREEYKLIKSLAKELVVIDHHQTAHLEIGDLVTIDQSKSGAVLAWEYLFPDEVTPEIILAVGDRDLWKWEIPHSKEVTEAAFLNGLTIEGFDKTIRGGFFKAIATGKILRQVKENEVKELVKIGRELNFHGYKALLINAGPNVRSELGNYVCKELGYEVAIIYRDLPNGRSFSLRSIDVDVEEIARVHYGGGGHKQASGFSLPYGTELTDIG